MSKSIIMEIRNKIIAKYNLDKTQSTSMLFKKVIKIEPSKRAIILRIEYLLNKEALESQDIKSLLYLTEKL